jgi:hypothetical protein
MSVVSRRTCFTFRRLTMDRVTLQGPGFDVRHRPAPELADRRPKPDADWPPLTTTTRIAPPELTAP